MCILLSPLNLWLKRGGIYLVLMWLGVPRHSNLPWDIMASLVHKNSHSSMEWEVRTTAESPYVICFCIRLHTSRLVTASIPLREQEDAFFTGGKFFRSYSSFFTWLARPSESNVGFQAKTLLCKAFFSCHHLNLDIWLANDLLNPCLVKPF